MLIKYFGSFTAALAMILFLFVAQVKDKLSGRRSNEA